jgi:hypothetical protein
MTQEISKTYLKLFKSSGDLFLLAGQYLDGNLASLDISFGHEFPDIFEIQ